MKFLSESLNIGSGNLKVLIKDTIDIKGTQTRAGSAALESVACAKENAEIIDRILANDCEITGKTTLHELAYGITGINKYAGTPVNYHYPKLIPGGSSSGSAVGVAAGRAHFSVGTDTGGSVRMPAACCGIFGLKPTFSRISRKGVLPQNSSLDCVGPFAATMPMLIKAMAILDPEFDSAVATQKLAVKPRFAVLKVQADDEVWQTIFKFLVSRQLGQIAKEQSQYIAQAYSAGMHVINYETWQAFGHLTQSQKLGADVQQRLLNASKTTKEDVDAANVIRAQFTAEIEMLLEKYDALILPTLPQIPPKLVDAENTLAFLDLTALVRPFNLSGHPAITLPLETENHEPVGLQIITRKNADEYLCALSLYLLEQPIA